MLDVDKTLPLAVLVVLGPLQGLAQEVLTLLCLVQHPVDYRHVLPAGEVVRVVGRLQVLQTLVFGFIKFVFLEIVDG